VKYNVIEIDPQVGPAKLKTPNLNSSAGGPGGLFDHLGEDIAVKGAAA
jgi:hypothetical protein